MIEFCRKDESFYFSAAVGGTGFKDRHWGLNDDLYRDSVNVSKKLLSGNPNNKIVGILWHQGECEVNRNASYSYYYDKLTKLLHGYRKELSLGDVPFIAGDFVPQWAATKTNSKEISNATIAVLNENNLCGYVHTDGLSSNNDTADMIHFNDASARELGKRYFEEFKRLTQK